MVGASLFGRIILPNILLVSLSDSKGRRKSHERTGGKPVIIHYRHH